MYLWIIPNSKFHNISYIICERAALNSYKCYIFERFVTQTDTAETKISQKVNQGKINTFQKIYGSVSFTIIAYFSI